MRSRSLLFLLAWCLCATPAQARGPALDTTDAPTPTERCALRLKDTLGRGRRESFARLLARCARRAPEDPRWAHASALVWPAELEAYVEPSPELREVLERSRTYAEAVPRPDPELVRLRAWTMLVLDGVAELEAGPQDAPGAAWWRRTAALLWRRHAHDDAERALRRAARSMPQDEELARDLAALLVARGRPDEAVSILGLARAAQPEERALMRELALALVAAGRGEDGLAMLETLARHDASGEALLLLATATLELGRADPARRLAEQAARRLPHERAASAHALRGLACLALGRRDEALAALRLGANDPRAQAALTALGQVAPM